MVALVVGSPTPIPEARIEFLAPSFGLGAALAVESGWRGNQQMILYLSIKKVIIKENFIKL